MEADLQRIQPSRHLAPTFRHCEELNSAVKLGMVVQASDLGTQEAEREDL